MTTPQPIAEIVAEVDRERIHFHTASPDALQALLDTAGAYGLLFPGASAVGPHTLYVAPLYRVMAVAAHFAGEHVRIVRPPRAAGSVDAIH